MILQRLMTVEVDLPDAPAGCEWVLLSDAIVQVGLQRGDQRLGFLTYSSIVGARASMHLRDGMYDHSEHDTPHDAAIALFARLGLEVQNG